MSSYDFQALEPLNNVAPRNLIIAVGWNLIMFAILFMLLLNVVTDDCCHTMAICTYVHVVYIMMGIIMLFCSRLF